LNHSADLGASTQLLKAVSANPELGRLVRLYRPAPTVAFSRREETMAAFGDAVSEAVAFGFEPVVRPAGGRMVALDPQWVVLDVITPEPTRSMSHQDVYTRYGDGFVEMLTELGVQANFGPVAGEYCPGDYSVNARNAVKLVGTAQRVTRGARLFSASIPLSISPNVGELFTRVNAILGLEWNAATLGALEHEVPGITGDALETALLNTFAPDIHEECSLADVLDFAQRLAA
jgi:lipoate-protein ligase A